MNKFIFGVNVIKQSICVVFHGGCENDNFKISGGLFEAFLDAFSNINTGFLSLSIS